MLTSKPVKFPRAVVLSLLSSATLAAALHAATQALPPGDHAAHRLQFEKPLKLVLPQSAAFSILGHSCGGIGEEGYVTGFDTTSGYPTGAVYLSTTCSSGGIGSHPVTYTAWAGVTWNFAGGVVSATALASAPTIDPTFTATDAFGDVIYNASSSAYLIVPLPAAPSGVTVVQAGDEFQIAWTPTGVNPAAVESSTLKAKPVNSTAAILTTTVTGPATNGVIASLQPSTTYQITVVNTTISGNGPASIPFVVTTSPATQPPGAPTSVAAHWTNPDPSGPTDTLVATWHAADPGDSPVDQYLVKITNHDTGGTITQTVSGTTLTASFVVDWVPNWSVIVQAHNAAGWGPWSSSFTLGGL
jgi:hypothetical protein